MQTKTVKFPSHLFSFGSAELVSHTNLMTCVIFGRENPVFVANDQVEINADIVCIKPDIPHRVVTGEGGAEILYLDGLQLSRSYEMFERLDPRWKNIPDAFQRGDYESIGQLRRELEGNCPAPDPRIIEIVEQFYIFPQGRMSQHQLSAKLGLERTRALRHFKANTGQTFRKYKIWAAIVAVAQNAHQGEQIGHAGVDAGFSDAAHTSRTAMDVFGMTPTMALTSLQNVSTLR